MDIVKRLCADDIEAVELIKDTTTTEHGGDRRSEGFKRGNTTLDKSDHNDAGYALRRLCQDRPDLHAKVIGGLGPLSGAPRHPAGPLADLAAGLPPIEAPIGRVGGGGGRVVVIGTFIDPEPREDGPAISIAGGN